MKQRKLKLSEIVGRGYASFWNSKQRYVVCKGGRGSKKSKTSALKLIVNLMAYKEANALVIRRYERTLRNSCYSDLVWAVHRLGVEEYWDFKVSPLEITHKLTGQKILFRGFDDAQKITSISVPTGVLCWVWIDEAYQIEDENEFNKLDLSIRGQLPAGLWKQFILTLNPWSERWWGKKRFFDNPNDDTLALTTTYLCNEWLDPDDIAIFERMKLDQPRRYKVEGLGEWGLSTGTIYENVVELEFDFDALNKDDECQAFYGLDFGFTDPTAFVGGFVNQRDKKIYITRCFLVRGLTNAEIAEKIKAEGLRGEEVQCDAAEPKSIEELRGLGVNAVAAPKGADSVRYGIQLIQQYQIIVAPDVPNFYNEITNYTWATDSSGNPTDKPDHEFSHVPDALRYGVVGKLNSTSFSWQKIFK